MVTANLVIAQPLDQVKTVHGRQFEVAHHGVRQQPQRRFDALFRIRHSDDMRAFRLE